MGAAPHGRAFAHAPHATHAPHNDACGLVVVVEVETAALRQDGHHGVSGDGAKLVGEGAVVDEDDDGEDPLADGGCVLQNETLVDEENAT